ncbi:MAG: GAF domain-containing protein, partial [Phycisphaeraceae bacterium]|nr:GAF domain-containing protein [Phycisphaeraceae bacterium]
MTRAEHELDILEKISQLLGETLELGQVFQRAMALLSESLNVQRASLALWDDSIEQVRIVAAIGLTREEMQRGRYALGEGITGKVLATGKPHVTPDIHRDPAFLNRTGSRPTPKPGDPATPPTSFICVPVKDGDRHV